jgi:hypothetical protein
MVSANTRPVTVIMVVDTTISSPRASSALPWNASTRKGASSPIDPLDSTAPAAKKTTTDTVGSAHSVPRA